MVPLCLPAMQSAREWCRPLTALLGLPKTLANLVETILDIIFVRMCLRKISRDTYRLDALR
jgi:hypothetical protein